MLKFKMEVPLLKFSCTLKLRFTFTQLCDIFVASILYMYVIKICVKVEAYADIPYVN